MKNNQDIYSVIIKKVTTHSIDNWITFEESLNSSIMNGLVNNSIKKTILKDIIESFINDIYEEWEGMSEPEETINFFCQNSYGIPLKI